MLPLLLLLLSLLPVLWAGRGDNIGIMNLKSPVRGQVKLCVFIPCTFTLPASIANESVTHLAGEWIKSTQDLGADPPFASTNKLKVVHANATGRFILHGEVWENNCSLTVQHMRKADEGTYLFVIKKPPQNYFFDKNLTLLVSERQLPPRVSISNPLRAGAPNVITCSVPWACEWQSPGIFVWLSSVSQFQLGSQAPLSSEVILTPRKKDNRSTLICQVEIPAFQVVAWKTLIVDVRCDSSSLSYCKDDPGSPKHAGSNISWVLVILVATVEAVITGLIGACLYRHFCRASIVAPTPVKSETPSPEAQEAPKDTADEIPEVTEAPPVDSEEAQEEAQEEEAQPQSSLEEATEEAEISA